jgi:hypothetical protein
MANLLNDQLYTALADEFAAHSESLETMRDVHPRAYALVCMQPAFLFVEATRAQQVR